jgi:hypothetical protein
MAQEGKTSMRGIALRLVSGHGSYQTVGRKALVMPTQGKLIDPRCAGQLTLVKELSGIDG